MSTSAPACHPAKPTSIGPPLHSASHQPQRGCGVSPGQPNLSEATLGFGCQETNPALLTHTTATSSVCSPFRSFMTLSLVISLLYLYGSALISRSPQDFTEMTVPERQLEEKFSERLLAL